MRVSLDLAGWMGARVCCWAESVLLFRWSGLLGWMSARAGVSWRRRGLPFVIEAGSVPSRSRQTAGSSLDVPG